MRFQIKPFSKVGDYRLVKRFAWFPVKYQNMLVWLESYWALEQYQEMGYWHCGYRSLEKPSDEQIKETLELEEWPPQGWPEDV